MNITKMSITDYEDAFNLWSTTKGMGLRSLDDSKEGIEKFLKRNPNTNFICRIDGVIAGVSLSGHDGRRGYIYHTVVKEEYRNQGIGRELVEATIISLKNEGINKVALVVFADNSSGNRFWMSLGFQQRNDLIYRNLSLNTENY